MSNRWALRVGLATGVGVVAGLALLGVWIQARRHSGGGKPISGLPIAFAYMSSAAIGLIAIVLLIAILVPWENLIGE